MIVFRIHRGNTPLQEGFQKDLAEKGRLAQNASSTAVMGSGPGLNQKEEASWVAAFGAHCFLTVDAMWPVASHSCRHALPPCWTILLLDYKALGTFLPGMVLVRYAATATQNVAGVWLVLESSLVQH